MCMKEISQLLHLTGRTCWSPPDASPGLRGDPSSVSGSNDEGTVSALWFEPLTLVEVGFCCGAGGEVSSVSDSRFIFLTSGSAISSLGDSEGDGADLSCVPDAEIPKSDPAFRFLICPMKCILMWSFNLSTEDSLYPQRMQQKSSEGEEPEDAEPDAAASGCVRGDFSVELFSCVA